MTRPATTEQTTTLRVVVAASFLAPLTASALNVALPAIGKTFAMDAVTLSWCVTSYILATAVLLLPCGRFADIRGRKKMFVRGMGVYSLGALLTAAAPSTPWFLLARLLTGAGAAMSFATGSAMLMSVIPPQQRGRALGWNVAAVYAGLSFGPFLGGLITHALGWRWIFLLNATAGLATAAFTAWKLKNEWMEADGERFDTAGAVLYGLALVALMFGFATLPRPLGVFLLLAGAAGLAGFARRELACESPILDLRALAGNSAFALANLAALINYSATAAVAYLLSLYLQYCRTLSPRDAGLVLIAQPLVMTVVSPLAGRLADRVDSGKLASLGMLFTAAGLFAFCFLQQDTPLHFVLAILAMLGVGFGLFSSPNTHAVMSSVAPRHYGVASSALSTVRLVGQMFSMGVVMLITTLLLGQGRIAAAGHPDLFLRCARTSFIVFSVLCIPGIFASLARTKPRKTEGNTASAPLP